MAVIARLKMSLELHHVNPPYMTSENYLLVGVEKIKSDTCDNKKNEVEFTNIRRFITDQHFGDYLLWLKTFS